MYAVRRGLLRLGQMHAVLDLSRPDDDGVSAPQVTVATGVVGAAVGWLPPGWLDLGAASDDGGSSGDEIEGVLDGGSERLATVLVA